MMDTKKEPTKEQKLIIEIGIENAAFLWKLRHGYDPRWRQIMAEYLLAEDV